MTIISIYYERKAIEKALITFLNQPLAINAHNLSMLSGIEVKPTDVGDINLERLRYEMKVNIIAKDQYFRSLSFWVTPDGKEDSCETRIHYMTCDFTEKIRKAGFQTHEIHVTINNVHLPALLYQF